MVLVAPEIHWNTGNIGRTCLGAGAFLHLVKPLGFSLDSRQVQRAGLDYWDRVALRVWDSFDCFEKALSPEPGEIVLVTKRGRRSFWEMPSPERLFMVFGSETRGLPRSLLRRFAEATHHIPMRGEIRSLNLSTAVGIVLYESLRRHGAAHRWPTDAWAGA